MAKERAKLFVNEPEPEPDLDLDLGLDTFQPVTGPMPSALPAEEVRAVAEAAKFPSRQAKPREAATALEPMPAPAVRQARRLRTGRTEQLNARASAQTVADFYAIADRHGWKAAETLERAVAALKRETEGQGRAGA